MRFNNTKAPPSGNYISLELPDVPGLTGLWDMRVDAARSTLNHVTGIRSAVLGNVAYEAGYAKFSLASFLTDVMETADITAMVIAKSPSSGAGNANLPVYLANVDAPSQLDPLRTSQGVSIFGTSANTIGGAAARVVAGVGNAGNSNVNVANLSDWRLYALRASDTVRWVADLTNGVITTAAATPRDPATSPLMWGGGIATHGGEAHIAVGATCSIANTLGDVAILAAYMRTLASHRDIIV